MYLTERGERRVCRRSVRTAVAQLPAFRALLSQPGSVEKVIMNIIEMCNRKGYHRWL